MINYIILIIVFCVSFTVGFVRTRRFNKLRTEINICNYRFSLIEERLTDIESYLEKTPTGKRFLITGIMHEKS